MKVRRIPMIALLSLFSLDIVTDNQDQINEFLASLSSKKKKKSLARSKRRAKKSFTASFLNSLSGLKHKQDQLEQTIKQDQQDQKHLESAALTNISEFYGNPNYQAAMKILNNSELEASYQDDLNSIHLFFFDYSNKVIKKYHRSDKDSPASDQQSVTSFLSSLHKQASPDRATESHVASSKDSKASQSKVASFLSSLKG